MRMMHLHKGGSGFASKTACGRNLMRTPMSTDWKDFKSLPESQQCEKCRNSKQAALNARNEK